MTTVRRHDADSRPDVRNVTVRTEMRSDLAAVEQLFAAVVPLEGARAVHVDPLCLELSVPVENLDSMVLTVGNVTPQPYHPCDIVSDVELAGIGTGPPRHDQLPIGRIFVHARVIVTVRGVNFALGRERHVGAAAKRFAAEELGRFPGVRGSREPCPQGYTFEPNDRRRPRVVTVGPRCGYRKARTKSIFSPMIKA